MSHTCKYPERCGSDGKYCCHHECAWSLHEQLKREHFRSLSEKLKRKAAR